MLHRRLEARETPRGEAQKNNARMCFARRLLPALCILALSAALGACSSDKESKDTEGLGLRVEFTPGTAMFSPLGERFATFSVTVSGFKNEADAHSVELGAKAKPAWLSLEPSPTGFSGGSKTFAVVLRYFGTTFAEGSATLQLGLSSIPEGYEYSAGPQTLRIEVAGGQTRDRPIPLTQANIRAFNRYANTEEGLALHYKLVENVVLEAPSAPETSNWKPIGKELDDPHTEPFTGSLDGNGHTLSGLVIHNPEASGQGLFGVIGKGALIQNLGLIDVSVNSSSHVGGLVGWNEGGTVHNSYATGNVNGDARVGGLVGYNEGGTVQNSYASVSVSGGSEASGLVGYNDGGTVQNSYATGNVSGSGNVGGLVGANTGGIVQNSYAMGIVSGNNNVGGLVGYNNHIVQNSYATGDVLGNNDNVGGLVGYNYGGTVQNCVALSPSVTTTANNASSLGRVVGTGGASLSGNRAREDMDIRYEVDTNGTGGDPKALADGGNNSSSVDGLSVSAGLEATQYNHLLFWNSAPFSWNFDTLWEWGANGLPILQNVGGAQNHTVP